LIHAAKKNHTALFTSTLPSNKLIGHVNYFLDKLLAEKLIIHGVFMDVAGIGVLLTGESSVGKSELALELITRGHRLVADDAPEFTRVSPITLRGSCPELLRDFLEVRGLGVLNVRAMFGDSAIKLTKNLRLIINLVPTGTLKPAEIDRLQGTQKYRHLLEVEVPEIQLPIAPGRNIAVLIEAAARNHTLYYNGYNAAEDFIERQRKKLEQNNP
ncbi:MAG: HPr(Ser) kinase/phosphatase, partial [Gammaproteobacteria bacterium]|nr:HPr(Ser) kinase/phosphatase [Gammaproteobacteria bacterium]